MLEYPWKRIQLLMELAEIATLASKPDLARNGLFERSADFVLDDESLTTNATYAVGYFLYEEEVDEVSAFAQQLHDFILKLEDQYDDAAAVRQPGWPELATAAERLRARIEARDDGEGTDDQYVADKAEPRRRFWLFRDPVAGSEDETRGWSFLYEEMSEDGDWAPGQDTWEEWFFEILRYLPEYGATDLQWRRVSTGDVVDLLALQPKYDGKPISPDETPESAGLRPPG